jgi:hypothetical protein
MIFGISMVRIRLSELDDAVKAFTPVVGTSKSVFCSENLAIPQPFLVAESAPVSPQTKSNDVHTENF